MKKSKSKALLITFVALSFTCFIYLNTRQEVSNYNYKSDYTTIDSKTPDLEKEDKSSYHVLKTGIVLIFKALVLSDK